MKHTDLILSTCGTVSKDLIEQAIRLAYHLDDHLHPLLAELIAKQIDTTYKG